MKILDLKIGDIPDQITKSLVIKMVERMYEGHEEFGDWMHDVERSKEQHLKDQIEELLDFINYGEMSD